MNLRIESGTDLKPLAFGSRTLELECLARYKRGDINALYDLGVACSTGSHGMPCDMVEAHKWFNIAAVKGHEEAAWCRADIAEEITAREIAAAQREARRWLSMGSKLAA